MSRARLTVGALALLLLAGCHHVPRTEDNTARWIAHPEFPAAAKAAPALMRDILTTTTRLETAAAKK